MRDFFNSAKEVFVNVRNYFKNGRWVFFGRGEVSNQSEVQTAQTNNSTQEVSSPKRRRTKKES